MDLVWNNIGVAATFLVAMTLLVVLFLARKSKHDVEERRRSDTPKSTLAADAPNTRPGPPVD